MAITKATASSIAPAAKGNLVVGSATNDAAVLGVGANDTVLTADSAEATGLKWATPSAGSLTLLSTTTLSGASTAITSISQSYYDLEIHIYGVTNATANGLFTCVPRNSTTSLNVTTIAPTDVSGGVLIFEPTVGARLCTTNTELRLDRTSANNFWVIRIANYSSTTNFKSFEVSGSYFNDYNTAQRARFNFGAVVSNSAVDGLLLSNTGGNLSTGTVLVYGVK